MVFLAILNFFLSQTIFNLIVCYSSGFNRTHYVIIEIFTYYTYTAFN